MGDVRGRAQDHGELRAQSAGLHVLVAELRAENAVLRERVEELERRVNRDSRYSSQPPSFDPPKSGAERRREAREKLEELSRRKPGGQPGHEGSYRQMAPPEQVDRCTEHRPRVCSCGYSFDGSEQRVGDPLIH
jgi:transposase